MWVKAILTKRLSDLFLMIVITRWTVDDEAVPYVETLSVVVIDGPLGV